MRLAVAALTILVCGCASAPKPMIDYDTKPDPQLQATLETIDSAIRTKYGIAPEQTDAGLVDLATGRVAMIHPDQIEYAASVAKIGILLAYFHLHPEAARSLDAQTKHELGLMIKASSNEMAAKYSRAMGLREIQAVLNTDGFYDATHGGGIWVGKHYGPNSERIGDPVANHSHAATVRQLLRFYVLLDEGKLVSPAASQRMREIFASPDIPADDLKFVKALAGRHLQILRKWGSWEDWLHDTALITGPGRHYILVGLTHHPNGDSYLEDLAVVVDDLMTARRRTAAIVASADDRGRRHNRGGVDAMDELRQQLLDLLTRDHAHAGFDAAIKDLPPELRGKRPKGVEHSLWEILEHLRLAQADMLEYIRNPKYAAPEWPAGYWPKSPKPPDDAAWDKSVKAFRRDRKALAALLQDESKDLLAPIGYAGGKSLLRDVLVIADHNAYHLGQFVQLRRLLGAWGS